MGAISDTESNSNELQEARERENIGWKIQDLRLDYSKRRIQHKGRRVPFKTTAFEEPNHRYISTSRRCRFIDFFASLFFYFLFFNMKLKKKKKKKI